VKEKINTSLQINKEISNNQPKENIDKNPTSNKNVECDLCEKFWTARGFSKHRNDCAKKP